MLGVGIDWAEDFHLLALGSPGAGVFEVVRVEHRPEAVLLAGDPHSVEAVLGQLKKHPDTRHVPVAVIADPAVRIDALRAGAAVFIDEPAQESELEQVLARLKRFSASGPRRRWRTWASTGPRWACSRTTISRRARSC